MSTYVVWLINYFAFYILWVICIGAARLDMAYIAVPIVIFYLIFHLTFISRDWKKEILLIVALTAVGAFNESALSLLGAITYEGALWGGVSWWSLCLWASFATTCWYAFSWLCSRPLLAAFLGGAVMPICYASIARLNVIQYSDATRAMLTVGAVWALMLPCTFLISKSIQRGFVGSK